MADPARPASEMSTSKVLKSDLFGVILKEKRLVEGQNIDVIIRQTDAARWWLRPVARLLAAREARILRHLPLHPGLPSLIDWDGKRLCRSFVEGLPMQSVKPADAKYFRTARTLLHQVHLAGVAHNDTAKEPNWMVLPDGTAGLVDFQLAGFFVRRNKRFRTLAFEDIRHLLKHKRSYRPSSLTAREQSILANPALHSRIWASTGKKVYLFVTRRLLKWQDREGANDRQL